MIQTNKMKENKYNWHGVEKTIRHVRTVKTRISLCNLIRVFFFLLVRFLYCFVESPKGHFEQLTDMSLPCLNLCHRIHFRLI